MTGWDDIARDDSARSRAVSARLATLAVIATSIVVLGYLFAIRTVRGQLLDYEAWFGRNAATARAAHASRIVLETISVGSLAIALAVLVVVAFGRRRPRLALVVGFVTFGACVTTETLKHVILTRPPLVEKAIIPHNTYPSGHSTVAMAVAIAALLVAPHHWRGVVGLVGLAYASAVGTATLVVGWHRPSDVIGGFSVAIAWGAAGAFVLVTWRGTGMRSETHRRSEAPHLATLLGACGVGLVVAAVALLVGVVGRSDELFALDRTRAFVAAVVAIGATAALLGAGLLGSLRDVTLDPPTVSDDRADFRTARDRMVTESATPAAS
jgi:membrane-associated phospholipid phosphatase